MESDPEEDAAALRFAKFPQSSISAAKRGSPYDINAIGDSIMSKHCPSGRMASAVYAIAEGVNIIAKNAAKDFLYGTVEARAMITAVRAFNSLSPSFLQTRKSLLALLRSPNLEHYLKKIIWNMILELDDVYCVADMSSSSEDMDIEESFDDLDDLPLMILQSLVEVCTFLIRDGLCGTDVNLWKDIIASLTNKCLSDHPYEEEVLLTKALCIICSPLSSCPCGEVTNTQDVILEAALDAGFPLQDFIRISMHRLENAAKADKAVYLGMFVNQLASNRDRRDNKREAIRRSCHESFLKYDGIDILLRTITEGFNSPLDETSRFSRAVAANVDVNILSDGFVILAHVLESLGSLQPLREALKVNLMQCLLFVSLPQVLDKLSKKTKDSIKKIIGQILAQAVLIHRIQKDVRRGFKWFRDKDPSSPQCQCGDCCGLEGVEELLGGSEVLPEWNSLLSHISHIYCGFKLFRKQRKREAHVCGNPSCATQGTRRSLHKCAGCQTALFCSSTCQSIAWNEHGHKTACYQFQALQESSGLRPLEMYLLARYAQEEVRRRMLTVLAGYEDQNKNVDDAKKVALVDSDNHGIYINYGASGPCGGSFVVGPFKKNTPCCALLKAPIRFTLKLPMEDWRAAALASDSDSDSDAVGGAGTDGGESGEFETILEIRYPVGGEVKILYVDTSFTWAALEGRECSCCRLHLNTTHTSDDCPMHGSSE